MKVAISFLGTGKYLDFLPKYYENIEKYFLPNSDKTILAFTDGELDEVPENIKVFSQEHLNWPYITLKRFEIINKAREIISNHDWFVFIDGDALVVDRIEEENFFTDKPLFGVHHPCHYLKMPPHNQYPGAYEITENCNAAVDLEKYQPKVYYQGCFWGGRTPEVCAMIDELEYRVGDDLRRNVVALWHDESHLNKYFIENPDLVHTYGPEYAFPEVFKDQCTFEPKIVHLAKNNSQYQQ
tara:strand:- start:2966 stop:3685 length:720 start_codon:yes stop_codon:yes gene_type:complete